MFLEDVPDDSAVFVDANILLYGISGHPAHGKSCNGFLGRVKREEIKGITSIIVLNEVLHKLILGEIAEKHGLKLYQVIDLIKQNPEILKDMRTYEIMDKVESTSNLSILNATSQNFTQARKLMKGHSLLSNDAIHLAIMKENNMINLASNDSDFERVEWIKLYKPSREESKK